MNRRAAISCSVLELQIRDASRLPADTGLNLNRRETIFRRYSRICAAVSRENSLRPLTVVWPSPSRNLQMVLMRRHAGVLGETSFAAMRGSTQLDCQAIKKVYVVIQARLAASVSPSE